MRRRYSLNLVFNQIEINSVIIDSHYEKKHFHSMTDEIILKLVKQLDWIVMSPNIVKFPYYYFVQDRMLLNDKFYKLIWLLEDSESYIGVINAYRR